MKNDPIQGIVFDKHRTITFRNPPQNFEKVPYYIGCLKRQIKSYVKQQSVKRHKATFSTNLLPVQNASGSSTLSTAKSRAVEVSYSATTGSGVVISDFTAGAAVDGSADSAARRSTTRVVLR